MSSVAQGLHHGDATARDLIRLASLQHDVLAASCLQSIQSVREDSRFCVRPMASLHWDGSPILELDDHRCFMSKIMTASMEPVCIRRSRSM